MATIDIHHAHTLPDAAARKAVEDVAVKLGRKFGHGDVVPLSQTAHQKIPMRIKLGIASAALRLGCQAAGPVPSRHQLDHEGNRNVKIDRRWMSSVRVSSFSRMRTSSSILVCASGD